MGTEAEIEALVAAGDLEIDVIAIACIDAQDWKDARAALEQAASDAPTVRVCELMAEIEQGEFGDKGRAREWLSRAVRAPRDPAWVAGSYVSSAWLPVSPVTGELDAFEWKIPPSGLMYAPARPLPEAPPPAVEEDLEDVAAAEPEDITPVEDPEPQPEPVEEPKTEASEEPAEPQELNMTPASNGVAEPGQAAEPPRPDDPGPLGPDDTGDPQDKSWYQNVFTRQ